MSYSTQRLDKGEAAKHMKGRQPFFTLTLALDDDGEIIGTAHYDGEHLSGETETKCKMAGRLLSSAAPEVLSVVDAYIEMREMVDGLVEDMKAKGDEQPTSPEPPATETPFDRTGLKPHGTIIH